MSSYFIMFKGKRFKQQSKLNASTTENDLSLVADDYNKTSHKQKRSRGQQINRSVCAKMDIVETKKKKYSLQHRNNPEQHTANKKYIQYATDDEKIKTMIKINISQNFNTNFPLKIKEKASNTVTPIMRIILIDWLAQVLFDLDLSKQALHSAIHYLDQLLLKLSITKRQLQVYGLSCFMVAQKLESQRILTPRQASELLKFQIPQKEFIALEEHIMKTLEFKLRPVTMWTEMCILLKAFQSYFKEKLSQKWNNYKSRTLWIIQGVIMQNSYFEKTVIQKRLCISLVYSMILEYEASLIRYFPLFCKSITGQCQFKPQEIQPELKYLNKWLQRKCECPLPYSLDDYHPQLKMMAASCIHT